MISSASQEHRAGTIRLIKTTNKMKSLLVKIPSFSILWSTFCLILFNNIFVDGQADIASIFRDIDRNIPLIGSCDRAVYAGVTNCLANFRPSTTASRSSCCAYRKYRACISGLRDGHSFAVARQRCPPYAISMPVIWAVSDRIIGLRLSSCKEDRNACRSRTTSNGGNKRNKNNGSISRG
ncbi:hypothetical protein SSS_08753 [Sarcoptes scabiei]|uniref:Uncharacterized protein n=2 Tax=Sarcoptes scabiei TaxID=52283 RepID=A0A834RA33_SARSC|nr:hypothetical protein SSS_08753 [Sarcoptes scabiei]